MREDLAVFILSHGRPNNVVTINTLQKCGYTGKWYIIMDNEDKTINEYKQNFGEDHIIVFDRISQAANNEFDIGDTFDMGRNTIVYARNKCFDIAKSLGLRYFMEFEDDYSAFSHRWTTDKEDCGTLYTKPVENLDAVFDAMVDYMQTCPQITTLAMAQAGDFIGGAGSAVWQSKVRRKAMNTFLCDVTRPFTFIGRMNDDVNTYVSEGSRGQLFLTYRDIMMTQAETQKTTGGNTEMYKAMGTYIKSFYSVMISPSCVKISILGPSHQRIHHSINWENAVPQIISDKFKKY